MEGFTLFGVGFFAFVLIGLRYEIRKLEDRMNDLETKVNELHNRMFPLDR